MSRVKIIGSDTAITASLVGSIIVAIFSVLNYLGSYATKEEVAQLTVQVNRLENRIDRILLKQSGYRGGGSSSNSAGHHPIDSCRVDDSFHTTPAAFTRDPSES